MVSVASQLIEEVTARAQNDCLEDAREICADGTYFLNNLRISQGNGDYFPVHSKDIGLYNGEGYPSYMRYV